ncbi:MAG: oligosaccharide flippase family protein [Nevskia sp.]|nr:oligosaccharide flippase family protein [Nevskia sp.]
MSEATPTRSVFARTARGTGWLIVWRMATRLLGLVSTVALVRLLAPEDFGLIALATSFTLVIEAMALIDVEDAVTRARAPSRAVYDTAFTLGLLRGLAVGGMIAALAIPAARFFAEPRLTPVIFALGLGFLIDGLTNVGIVDFRRDFAFHREVQLWLAPRLLSILLTLSCAVLWRSYWALVVGILSQRALRVAFSYRMHPFRPRLGLAAWRGLLGYSLWVSAINVASLLRDRVDNILLGRLLGTAPVGIFAIGTEIAALPTTELVEPACRAAFSGFSAARHTGVDTGQTWLAIIAGMTLLTFPAGIGLALIAGPLVQLAFGARWLAAVPLVQLLGIAGCLTVFGTIGSVLLRVHGKMRLVLAIILAGAAFRVSLLLVLIPRFGLLGAGFAVACGLVFDHLLYLAITLRGFAIPPAALLGRLWRSILATAAMTAVLLWCGFTGPAGASPTLAVLSGVAIGAAVYIATLLALWTLVGRPDGAERHALVALRRLLSLKDSI